MTDSQTGDTYTLRRDFAASTRLNAQHGLWTDTFGWILHPRLESVLLEKDNAEIVDVGTGTGIVLLHLSSKLAKQPKALVGTDISDAQYPRATWLPQNVRFITVDILDPNGPPPELQGRFDVVHARFLLSLVRNNDPERLIEHFYKLLKPGGYLQWGEPMNSEFIVRQANESAITTGLQNFTDTIRNKIPFQWIDDLPATLGQSGFEIQDVNKIEPKQWQLGWWRDTWFGVLDEYRRGGPPLTDLYQQVCAEWNEGSWVKFQFLCVVAQKIEQ